MLVLRHRLLCAVLFVVGWSRPAHAQAATGRRGAHDSITVTTLTFPGAVHVTPADFKPLLFTRPSQCRLPFLVPICAVWPSQLVVDRRRTTSAALGEDMDQLRIYFFRRGYRSATVDTVLTPGKQGTAIEFRIVEGPPTVVSSMVVAQKTPVLSDREMSELVELHAGDAFDLVALDSTLSRLHAAIWNKGYGDVRIDTSAPRPDASLQVPVRITIDPRWITRVGSVHFDGNGYLSQGTLARGVMLRPGALYTRNAVLESEKRLFALPAIAQALVVTPPEGDSIKSVTVDVAETAAHQASLTLGFNTIDFGQAAAEFRHNALGDGRWLSFRAAASNLLAQQLNGQFVFRRAADDVLGGNNVFLRPTYQSSLTLTQPWIAGARTSAALTAFAGRRALSAVVVDEDYGASLGIVRDLAPRIPVGINYRFEENRVQGTAVYFCAGYGICDLSTRASLTRWQRLAPVGVSGWIDRSDDLEVPTQGYTAVIDAEHASSITGSTFAHNRITGDASFYHALGVRKSINGDEQLPRVLAIHLRGGFVRPLSSDRRALGLPDTGAGILHPRARFYAGGMQSVRGFAENELGPTVLQVRRESLLSAGCTDVTIASGQCDPSNISSDQFFARPVGGSTLVEGSVEARLPVLKGLGAVAFLDGAYVGVSGLSSPARGRGAVTPGVGFRYQSPLGILRMDFGLRPLGAESLPVLVATTDASGNETIVRLAKEKNFSLVEPSPGTLRTLARRIVVHFAMGQAF